MGGVCPLPAMAPDHDAVQRALQCLLTAVAGPNYARALQQGELPQQLDRCIDWVKAEASEASSLIESCVPHGKPMLAQAQKRLEALEALQALDQLRAAHYEPPLNAFFLAKTNPVQVVQVNYLEAVGCPLTIPWCR